MKKLFVLILMLFAITVEVYAQRTNKVLLENGIELLVEQIQASRILPHAFYDQAITSIPGVYPNAQIITKERLGFLGQDRTMLYSLVCYKEDKEHEQVKISGVVTHKNKAWSFATKVAESDFNKTLAQVMEVIAELSSVGVTGQTINQQKL